MKLTAEQISILRQAAAIQEQRAKYDPEMSFTKADDAKVYFANRLAGEEREVFDVSMLDNQHRLIKTERLFAGTIDGAAVYPREIVKSALLNNAAAIVIAHNHPSGITEPSAADLRITKRIRQALETVDMRLLDHIIVGSTAISLAETGQI